MLLAEMQQGWQKKMVREEGRHFDPLLQNCRRKKKVIKGEYQESGR